MATIHGRDVVQEIELAATSDGTITAVRARLVGGDGRVPPARHAGDPAARRLALLAAATTSRRYDFECTGVFTHTTPTDAYRGAGRPEATYAIERAVDALAREARHGSGRAAPDATSSRSSRPTIASGLTVDSGDYDASLDKALELLDLDALRRRAGRTARRAATRSSSGSASRPTSRCAGSRPSRILGAIRYGAGGWDAATIRCLPSGTVQVLTGTSPHGQGHETTWSQIAADGSATASTRSRCCTATRRSPRSGWTRTAAAASPSAASRCTGGAEDRREGPDARGPPARGRRGRARVRGRHVQRRTASR